MDFIWNSITDWLKEVLVSGIVSNLSGMFDSTNEQIGQIAGQVGLTPQAWNSGIFNMIQNLSNNVILPLAGAILAVVMTLELIQLITDRNNLNDVDTWMFFKWVFKSAAAVLIVSNTWTIVMGIFDAAQSVVNGAAGVMIGNTSIDISSVVTDLESRLMEMDVGPLLGLWFQSLFVGICTWAITICIFIVIYGRMIEVYLVTSVAPIPMATMANREWGQMGQNYLRTLFALGFQAFLIMVCVAIYSVLVQNMSQVQTVCAAIHEMAHSRLHNYEKMTELADDGETILVPGEKDRNTEEVEAESISYAVCQYFGIETADNSFGYIASWSQGKALKELRASLETINKTSSELISGIEQHYREICKEKGIDLAADAPAQEQPQVPDAAEQALDEYPMPDESVKVADLKTCGYVDGDMLSLSIERAVELYDQDMTVYAIVDGGNAEMLFDREELDTQASGTVFSVSREEWEQSPMFHEKIVERQQHQEKRENAFLDHGGDCFAIYQVKRDDPGNVRFMNMDWMQSHGKAIARGSYDLIYTAPLTATGSTDSKLEAIFEQFNLHRPADYHSPSLSVSDIVAIKQNGVVSYHYCDSVGFKELPDFQKENYLKAAEMSTEDDYGMIDGIINNGKQPTVADLEQQAKSGQPISLMDLADAVHREKKPSVLEKLKDQPQQPQRKSKPRKSKEQEI